MNLEDFIDYEKDQKELGLSPETQAGALASSMQIAMRGTPQGQTGIKYWDEKKEITPYDAYLAKKFNDINFTGRLDINANTKTQSVTKLMGDLTETITGLKNAEEYLELGETNANKLSGMSRALNKMTLGWWNPSQDNARYQTSSYNFATSVAKATKSNPTQGQIKDTQTALGGGFQNEDTMAKKAGQMMNIQLNRLESQIEQLERQGQPIPYELIRDLLYFRNLAYHATTQDSFRYSKWYKTQQAQNTQPNTTKPSNQITPYTPTK